MTAVLLVRRPGAAVQLPPAGDTRSAAGRLAGTARRIVGLIAPWLVRGLLGLAVLAFLGLAVGPHVFGYRTLTMLTGSMAPEIDPGDVTVVTPIATSEVTEGMVITYHRPIEDHSLVTHRVVSVDTAPDGTVTVQTKGDANDSVDPWTATLEGDTAYQVRAVIPELGHLIEALRTPVLSQALLYGAPALLVGWVLMTIWRPADEAGADVTEAVEAAPAVEEKPAPKPATTNATKPAAKRATKPATKNTARPQAKSSARPAGKKTTKPAAKPAAKNVTKGAKA